MAKKMNQQQQQAIQLAIYKAGGMRALARSLGISYQAIQSWKKRIPAERIIEIENITGVPREQLRPDLYAKRDRDRS